MCVRHDCHAVSRCFHVFSICKIEKCTFIVAHCILSLFLSLVCLPLINIAFMKSNKRIEHRWKKQWFTYGDCVNKNNKLEKCWCLKLTMMSQRKKKSYQRRKTEEWKLSSICLHWQLFTDNPMLERRTLVDACKAMECKIRLLKRWSQ